MATGFRNRTYKQKSFRLKNPHATSSSQARCLCRILVNLVFISCHYINDQMKKLFLITKCPIERLHIDKKKYPICSLFGQLADKKLKSHWAQAHYEPVNLTGYVKLKANIMKFLH